MGCIGDKLVELCRGAENEIVIAAPFIKAGALSRALAEVKPSVTITCCTRWIPEEIASGVTDLEVWDILKARPGSKMFLRSNLHAKYYRADEVCLIGSANVTAAALGWRNDSNLEILTEVARATFAGFETGMFESAILVDERLYQSVRELVGRMKKSLARDEVSVAADTKWIPTLRAPEELFHFYNGDGERLSSASRVAAADDLSHFAILPGLERHSFETYVGLEFLQKPLIAGIDALLSTPQRFGAVTAFIRNRLPDVDADSAWQAIMRWMRYFLPSRYALAIPNHSEVFFRVDGTLNSKENSQRLEELVQSLNTDKSHAEWTVASRFQAPHKPLLLLSLLQMFQAGNIGSPSVEPSPELENRFNRLAAEVYPHLTLGEMSLPFYHLESDGLWVLVPRKLGAQIPDRARMSLANLRASVRCAEMRNEYYLSFLKQSKRQEILRVILDKYFSEQVATRLRAIIAPERTEKLSGS